ncbi:MFS monocarboxylate transporter [Pseudohyphozyma bogoriensis]|nr:MFS monocarboxylate transporter [Pseudohyphozyma bogoriensis]
MSTVSAHPLTAPALKALDQSQLASGSRISLSGDTPCPTPPESDIDDEDAETQVGSRPASIKGKEKEDLESASAGAMVPVLVDAKGMDVAPDGGVRAWLAVAGCMLMLFSTFGLSNSFGVFLQYYQLGLGVMFGPCLSCVGTYFRRLRGITLGMSAAGAAAGAIVYPLLLDAIFPSQGFAAGVRACGYLSIFCLALANLLMRPRPRPPTSSHTTRAAFATQLRPILRDPTFFLVGFGVFGGILGLFIIMFFVSSFTKTHTRNPVLAVHSLSILNASAFFGRLLIGTLGDRIGTFNACIPCGLVMGSTIFLMLAASSTAPAVVFLVVFGLSSGGYISITASLFMSLSKDLSEIGVRAGLGFLFIAVAALIGSPIAGAILSAAGGEYWAACVFGGGTTLVGTALLVGGRWVQSRRKATWKV